MPSLYIIYVIIDIVLDVLYNTFIFSEGLVVSLNHNFHYKQWLVTPHSDDAGVKPTVPPKELGQHILQPCSQWPGESLWLWGSIHSEQITQKMS